GPVLPRTRSRTARSAKAFLRTVPQQGHVWDGFSLRVFKTIGSHPASFRFGAEHIQERARGGVEDRAVEPRLRLHVPAGLLCRALGRCRHVRGRQLFVRISLWARTRRAVIWWLRSLPVS